MFQSTHPCGVRPTTIFRTAHRNRFQSTHPCGVRQSRVSEFKNYRGFNPRTRVGCDGTLDTTVEAGAVSIHAPVWGATRRTQFFALASGFNPRTREGCDATTRDQARIVFVSIHAPVRGATHFTSLTCARTLFQSTHP